jgi:endonuclease YncB( thermonuclease family)
MWDRRAQVLSVHDGDTIKVILDQGFGQTLTDPDGLRLLGVYAPELTQPGGPECRQFVSDWLAAHMPTQAVSWPFIVTTARMPRADREQETLGRYVGTLTTLDGSESLNAAVTQFIAANGYGSGIA